MDCNCSTLPVFLLCQFYLELATDLCDIYGASGVFGRMSSDTAYVQFICKIFSIKRFSYTLF